MDRAEIKSLAKEKIKGNLWNIWKPLLLIAVIAGLAGAITGAISERLGFIGFILSLVVEFGAMVLGASYTAWLIKFVRGENPDFNTIIDCVKAKWSQLLITCILVVIYVWLWSLLFIIPGIIKSFAYAMALLIVIDTDLSGNDAIKESMRMMDGYKFDYFVFQLSFIGWYILGCITFGLAYIWVMPYIMVAEIIYYDRLREKNGTVVTSTVTNTESTPAPDSEPEPEVIKEETTTPSLEDTVVGGGEETDPISDKE